MPLAASGEMSLGGSTSGRSVNIELGVSATAMISMNDTAARTLAEKTTADSTILMSDFYGKSRVPTVIGQSFGGGYYAGQISVAANGVASHYLIVAPVSSGQALRAWKNTDTVTPGTFSDIDGPTNSANMNDASHPAAQFCEGLSIGGYTDWYMPAQDELEVCYYNLKPTTASNDTMSGINIYAVPYRGSPYTSSTPGQTLSADFRDTGTQDFESTPGQGSAYWSSTMNSSTAEGYAWYQVFDGGFQLNDVTKSVSLYVRAIRRVPV